MLWGKGPETEMKNERLLLAGKNKEDPLFRNRIRKGVLHRPQPDSIWRA